VRLFSPTSELEGGADQHISPGLRALELLSDPVHACVCVFAALWVRGPTDSTIPTEGWDHGPW
jgi:hypothetical protein